MADIHLEKGKTMLLMADFSTSGIGQNPIAKERQTLERAREGAGRRTGCRNLRRLLYLALPPRSSRSVGPQ